MDDNVADSDKSARFEWDWTVLCGPQGSIVPLDPETHELHVCFQQLCLQIPVLILIAVVSAYYCGKANNSLQHRYPMFYFMRIRLLITGILALLPIVRAACIIFIKPGKHGLSSGHSVFSKLFFIKSYLNAAKPIDYLVAGTEGLCWVVHYCFVLSLRRGNANLYPRGPVSMNILISLIIGVSGLLLRTHLGRKPEDDVFPNFSLGFSLVVVGLLSLYALTLIPDPITRPEFGRNNIFINHEINERTSLLSAPGSSYVTFVEEQESSYLGEAMEDASFTSKLFFLWVNPLMDKGVYGQLKHPDDLFDLPVHISTSSIARQVETQLNDTTVPKIQRNGFENSMNDIDTIHEINDEVTFCDKLKLFTLLHKCFGWQFYAIGLLKFIADCSGFVAPILLNKLLGFIEDRQEPLLHGYIYAILLFVSALVGAFCGTHFTFWMSVIGLKIRTAIVTLVYRKTLYSSNFVLHQHFTFGEIINFVTTDTERIVNYGPSFHTVWSIPLQLVVTLYLLYKQIGISFLAGVTFTLILIPINKVIANKIGELSTKLMNYKDQRVRMTGEILRGIVAIKLNVWEQFFITSILRLREDEIKYLKGRKYLDALCVYFWATTPVLISILTFSTYVFLGNSLSAKTVFTTMALLNMMIGPLNSLPWVLNGLTEAWVSVKRIQRLLDIPDINTYDYYSEPPYGVDVMIKNATFSTKNQEGLDSSCLKEMPSPMAGIRKSVSFEDAQEGWFRLRNIDFALRRGDLVGVIGKVGSGKTLLLNAVLAEVEKDYGVVAVNSIDSGFAYVRQNPWLQRLTIRENILFGKNYEPNKYKNILKACCLNDDLNSLPKRDLTMIGEGGNTLSGGQKTRIALARAIYADKDLYLLDDILSTLDVKVAKEVFQNVVLGLLKNKTRILCTHQTQYLVHANLVIEMSKGVIVNQGKPSEVLSEDLVDDFLLSCEPSQSDYENKSLNSPKSDLKPMDESDIENDQTSTDDIEQMGHGRVNFAVYYAYFKAIGIYLAISIFISMLLMQSTRNISDLWLSYWVTHFNTSLVTAKIHVVDKVVERLVFDNSDFGDAGYYLTVYAVIVASNSLFTLIRAFIFAYGGIQAAQLMHKQLLKIVIRAKTLFFDIHPLGRILNRFSSDTYTVDDSLPFIANILFAQLFGLIGTVAVISYGLPWIFLILTPLVPIYHWLQNHYRLTSRELKRLSSTALSPLYEHFNESLQGLSSIRAYRATPRFKLENELYLDLSQRTQFSSAAANQWLSLRLQFIGVALLTGVAIMAVVQHQYDVADPGFIGIAITYTLSITGLLSGVINAYTETEREMIAVERVKEYLDTVPLENKMHGDSPPYAWPSQGVIEFREVALKYRDHLPPSLKNISFSTRPAEKIGIVGRTGAGKSSILQSLFRLTSITSGDILIDNVNINSLQLDALRSRLAIIPQNPFIFSGTIRENVDPLNEYPDLQVYKALEKCKVHTLVHRLGGLGAQLEEGGRNLSTGQKQLFCLVRAVLHNAKILCIDEATANIDQETDKSIQTTIQSSFRSSTVITIAHRIRTIMHCDRVLVMGEGEILEFDEPNLLIQDSNSYFYDLASQEFSEKE